MSDMNKLREELASAAAKLEDKWHLGYATAADVDNAGLMRRAINAIPEVPEDSRIKAFAASPAIVECGNSAMHDPHEYLSQGRRFWCPAR